MELTETSEREFARRESRKLCAACLPRQNGAVNILGSMRVGKGPARSSKGRTFDGSRRAGEAEETTARLEHEGDHRLAEVERAVKVDVDAGSDIVERQVEKRLDGEWGVGIEQGSANLVGWPLLLYGGECGLDRLGIGHIARERVGLRRDSIRVGREVGPGGDGAN